MFMIATVPAITRDRTSMKLRVFLADDHAIVRQAIKFMLEREGFEVVGEASDGQQAVKQCRDLQPDVAVLDLSMPLLNGVEAAREIIKSCPNSRVVILTEHTHDRYVRECLQLGVKGYVRKADTGSDLVDALLAASRGETYLTPSLSPTVQEAWSAGAVVKEPLGVQERRVLRLIAEGKNPKEIGDLLDISYKTVQSHRTNIMKKLDIQDVASLVRYAISCGLADP
jgi:DNA-binding NarL/FixJ family response regulator